MEELSKTYGGIFTIWIGRRPTVVISDPQIAIDLMEKRSNIYSAYGSLRSPTLSWWFFVPGLMIDGLDLWSWGSCI